MRMKLGVNQLAGFENDRKDGTRSTQRDDDWNSQTEYTHMIPKDALKKIGRVEIHFYPNNCITGFSFLDKDGALLWEIGWAHEDVFKVYKKTVVLEENEVIVGVVAKLSSDSQTEYTDFQF